VTLISLKGAVKSFGARRILDGVDLELAAGARVGIIGPNGSGKSTLLRIVAGLEEPDAGEAVRRRDLAVSYLPQIVPGTDRTPLEVVRAARPDLEAIEVDLARASARLGEPEVAADLALMGRVLRRQEELLERFTAAGGPGFEGRTRAQLADLGLDEDDLALPTSALSGGQRKLVALAACLAQEPDVLLLDEPETHLDAPHRGLLERLVAEFEGAVAVVSHDRYLLDETVGEIVELRDGRVRTWPGNYSAYAAAREIELLRQQQLYVTQQKELARLEEAVRRFRHWAHITVNERSARQARVKQMQIDRMEKVDRPVFERRKIALELRPHARGGERVCELRGVSVAFGDEPVLVGVDLTVLRGERVGVVGPNGSGKTVLLNVVAGGLEPTEGERRVGPSIRIGHLAQDAELPTPSRTPVEIVRAHHPCSEGEAVSRLMKFLFDYEQVRRPARLLSGGERTRLHLLLLMLGGANALILDEPTNHLDIDSVEMLEEALESFEGTAIFSSHDRYFLDRISDRVLDVGGGEVRSHEGGYSDWVARATPSAAGTP
jgi:ATP-binding cassette, subfamily F, member 3